MEATILRPSDLAHVALTLGGSAHVNRAELEVGAVSLRAYTKSGRPRFRRGSTLPLYIGAALIHPAYTRQPLNSEQKGD